MSHKPLPRADAVYGCEHPEAHPSPMHIDVSNLETCRGCLIAMIANGVNQPRYVTSARTSAASEALRWVQELLDEYDPLRVRAEQALIPLTEGSQ
jgi:hypothetical protein